MLGIRSASVSDDRPRVASLAPATLAIVVLAGCSGGPTASDAGDSPGDLPDAASAVDGAPVPTDASVDARPSDAAAQEAGVTDAAPAPACDASQSTYVCSADGNSRATCASGALVSEACPRGCLREPADQDAICMGTTDAWSCSGSYGDTKAQDGDYYLTAFGCWIDASGGEHIDPGDNCVPSCLAKAKAAGLCLSSDTGKDCEERVDWYTADGARFGCLARVRITNPANGKSVIAVALDYGPSCSVESSVSKAVVDASGRVDDYLFGSAQGASDRALVHVVEVDPTTPLGPVL